MCSVLLLCSVPCSARADTRSRATPSEWATPSELPAQHIQDAANSIVPPLANNVTEVVNTVDLTGVQAAVWFRGKDGTNFTKSVYLDSDGSFVIPDFQSDVGIDYAFRIEFYLRRGALPPAGKYTMSFSFSSDTGGWTYTNGAFYSNQANDNVADVINTVEFPIFSQFSGGANGQMTVDFGRVSNASIQLNLPENSNNGFSLPIGGKFFLRFVKLSSSADTDAVTAGGAQTTDDIQAGISNSVNVISSSVDEITDQIAELIQTIINQLDALWNQFSGEFTNMFTAWNTHVQTIINAIQNQGTTVSDGLNNVVDQVGQSSDEITDNADRNTEDLKENEDKNTNIITEALSALGNFIIEGLKSLFIPSDDFFQNWYTDLYNFFNDRLGLFMLPIDIVIQLINVYINTDSSFAGIPFPEFKWIDGTVIIPAQTVNFTFLETDWGQDIQEKIYFVTDIFMIFSLLVLLKKKLDEVFVQ